MSRTFLKIAILFFTIFATFRISASGNVHVANSTAYFADIFTNTIYRYSLEQEQYLEPLKLPRTIRAMHVENSKIYILFDTRTSPNGESLYEIYFYDLDGNNEQLLMETNEEFENFIVINDFFIFAGREHVYSVNKTTGEVIDDLANYTPKTFNAYKSDYNFAGRIALDTRLKELFFVAELRETFDQVIKAARIDEQGKFTLLDKEIVHSRSYGDLYTSDDVGYILTSNGFMYEKSSLQQMGVLSELNNDKFENHVFSRVIFFNSYVVTNDTNKLNVFNELGEKTYTHNFTTKKPYFTEYKGSVFAFSESQWFEKIDFADLLGFKIVDLASNELDFVPSFSILSQSGELIYLYTEGESRIRAWSIADEIFVDELTLSRVPDSISYSNTNNSFYLVNGNTVTSFDVLTKKEQSFISINREIKSVQAFGNVVLVKEDTPGGTTPYIHLYDLSGSLITSQNALTGSTQATFNGPFNRLYLFNGIISDWYEISESNTIEDSFNNWGDSGSHSLYGAISENGKFLASQSGVVVNTHSFREVGDFSQGADEIHEYIDWIFGNVVSLRQIDPSISRSIFTRVMPDFSLDEDDTFEIQGKPNNMLVNEKSNQVIVLTESQGRTKVFQIDLVAKDFDNDGVNDLIDEFPNNASLTKFSPDAFLPLNSAMQWQYDRDISATAEGTKTIYEKPIKPILFSTGSQLYFNNSGENLSFHGFYLPNVVIAGTAYAVDIQLENAIEFDRPRTLTGKGRVIISPTYGERGLNWQADIDTLGVVEVDTGNEVYQTLAYSIKFVATANVDGRSVALDYSATYHFAENIGLVKFSESDNINTVLQSYQTKPVIKDDTKSNENSASKSSGGSISLLLSAFVLTIIFARRNRFLVS